MFLARGKDGLDFYLGPDGLPVSFDNIAFFVGTEEAGRAEAKRRGEEYFKLSGQSVTIEYQRHALVDAEARTALAAKFRNYLIKGNNVGQK